MREKTGYGFNASRLEIQPNTLALKKTKTKKHARPGRLAAGSGSATVCRPSSKAPARLPQQTTVKARLSLNLTGQFEILVVGPSPSPPKKKYSEKTLLYLDLQCLVISRAKALNLLPPCTDASLALLSRHDTNNMLRYLLAGLTQYVLNSYLTRSSPYHLTTDGATEQVLRPDVSNISVH